MQNVLSAILFLLPTLLNAAELKIPAATAYLDPESDGVRVSEKQGISKWTDPRTGILWYGELKHAGALNASVILSLPEGQKSVLQLTIGNQTKPVMVQGNGTELVTAHFGEFNIAKAGYTSFRLASLNDAGQPIGDVDALVLDGPALKDAHFNLKPRRNAASVHLSYPVELDAKVSAFYCEMTGVEDPLWTYYMACGWHRGYFGMQVNSPTERRIIFSVWDSGNEAVDRENVDSENRVTLVGKGESVYTGGFGNEGTGGHSHLKFPWKTGEKQKFLVTAEPVSNTHTVYSGYYFRSDTKEWMLISSWKAPQEGGYMRGLYSFSENFIGRNGNVVRKALYGNQWIRTADGKWHEMTTAKFSHDVTGKEDRLDRFMGIEDGQFFLSHGGFIEGFTNYGTPFLREATGDSPANMKLPALSAVK